MLVHYAVDAFGSRTLTHACKHARINTHAQPRVVNSRLEEQGWEGGWREGIRGEEER